jgi:hypothetical protein
VKFRTIDCQSISLTIWFLGNGSTGFWLALFEQESDRCC